MSQRETATLHLSKWGKEERSMEATEMHQCLNTAVYCVFWALHGAFQQKPFDMATWKQIVEIGAGKRTRVIINTGSHRVSREYSLHNWHILPFCGSMWIIKKSLQNNFSSSSRTWTFSFICFTVRQNEPAKMTHCVFHLSPPPAFIPDTVALDQA